MVQSKSAVAKRSKAKVWLVDSGCGSDLISRSEVNDSSIRQADIPMNFHTANGSVDVESVSDEFISSFALCS